ncbi:hypothetical protein U6A24_21705 [Aquimarina gracilis]|uniref:Uncharacterized protein n=1 Tax=Aquimarina gracilis TaxID=874422 RepID=A0ABU6A1X9_9FLAO|nr:hypothetical protein [Aquimarina gracilis]MEB3348107.1 hypothetical protein [Aquimarina gracilis]
MIVWSGRGFLSILVLAVVLVTLTSFLPKEQNNLSFAISLFVAGIFSWIMGKKWNESNQKKFIDKETGEEIILKPNHSLFWIKMQYWGIIFGVLGIVMLVRQFM